jgi:predicted dehydrogenase
MDRLNIGIIGTGNISRYHAAAYKSLDNCNIIACSDIVKEKAQVFAKTYNVSKIYQDYKKMLSKEELDVISICTWPHLHSKITIDSAKANVKAIHCEKPMSHTWGSAKKMYKECKKRNIQLTINHQRRFGKPFCIAKELLKAGEIGELKRLEGSRDNIFDWGTHYVDMFGFYNEETPADWVMGQIDYLDVDWSKEYYGAPVENHGVFLWKYKNGVFGFFGSGASRSAIGADNRLIGTEGIIEVGVIDGPILRIKNENSSKWEILDTNDEDLHGYINPNIQEML